MLLAIGPSFEFVRFLQVLGWIILPVALVVLIIIISLHYRKKRSGNILSENEEEKLIGASPEQLGYTRGDGEYVFFDHSALITEYKNRLSYNHARYTALRHDFDKLQVRYADLASFAAINFTDKKALNIEYSCEQMAQPLQEDIAKLSAAYKAEKSELLSKLDQVMLSLKKLETENAALHDQLKETKQYNELLNASSSDDKGLIASLKLQYSNAQSRVLYLEQKLFSNKQLKQHLYKDLSSLAGEAEGQSPVITLHPNYENAENAEMAVPN